MYHLETNLIVTIHIVCLARMFNDSGVPGSHLMTPVHIAVDIGLKFALFYVIN